MEALPADEDAPQTGPDEPPLPAKPTAQALPKKASDDPRSGLDFLRATGAPVTPEPPRSTVHDSAARVTPTPPDSPHPVAFTLPPAVASCSKDPPPPSPSPTPSTVRVSVGPPSASSTPKRARNGKWAQSTLVVGGRRIPPPDIDKEAEQPEEVDIPVRADTGSPALTKMQLREQVYLEASINYETKWSQHFSWLVYGFQQMVHSISTYLTQVQMDHILASPFLGIQCDESTDRTRGKHMIVYLTFFKNRQIACEFFTLLTVERCDAGSLFEVLLNHLCSAAVDVSKIVGISTNGASVMTGKENGLVARLREHVPHLFSCHCIAHREALAVKDAAESNEDLGMVDKVVRTVATLLGNSSVWSQRFKYLQRVIYQTNLEVQGIHTVRWLSRGDAVRRLCKVLGACIVLLWEHNHKAYEIVTCYKFQFCLFFLADILADMNDLNRCFQRRELDVTEISKTIESTTGDLTERYLTTNKPFGGEGKSWLVNFLKVHKEGGGKQVRVRGVDGEGRPINHLYTMHERKLKGHKQGNTYADCVKLCRQFARDCVDNLNERLDDLGKLGPTKLFRAGKWPKIKAQREKKCKERWPNLLLLWQALAVLPLSTVECERGFSRQNIIKSWVRGALCNARLGELMQISLLKYEIEWPEALEVWRSMRRRCPVKSLKLAVAERERKGKQKEGEAVAAGTAGENEDEGGEEEEDDEVEQDLGDDQEVVEEEDNSFLSDDEDVEEVYFIDKPVH
ncbi:unnamed protein product [Closterium sp. NIES-53]